MATLLAHGIYVGLVLADERERCVCTGKWELLYTTSQSILGTSRPPFLRPIGPIFQYIGAIGSTHGVRQ